MAATNYSTFPSNTYMGLPSQSNDYRSGSHETYGSNIESSTAHPYQSNYGGYVPDRQQTFYHPNPTFPSQPPVHQMSTQRFDQSSNGFGNSQMTTKTNDKPLATNSHFDQNRMNTTTIQPTNVKTKETHPVVTKNPPQNPNPAPTQTRHAPPHDNLHHQQPHHPPSQQPRHSSPPPPQHHQKQPQQQNKSNLVRSEEQISGHPPKDSPPAIVQPTQKSKPRQVKPKKPAHPSVPAAGQLHSTSNNNSLNSESNFKGTGPAQDQRPNKSSMMRAAAIKNLENKREQKRRDKYFPTGENKNDKTGKPPQSSPETDVEFDDRRIIPREKKTRTQHPLTDGEQSDTEKGKLNKKQPHSVPKSRKPHTNDGEHSEPETSRTKKKPLPAHSHDRRHLTDDELSGTEKKKTNKKKAPSMPKNRNIHPPHTDGEQSETEKPKGAKGKVVNPKRKPRQSRRDDNHTDHNNTSDEEDHHRSKSRKRPVGPDAHLPPIRKNRGPPYFDPIFDGPVPPGHLARGRYPYYPDYHQYDYHRHRHLYEDAYDVPPYLAPYHDAYDPFFDYEKRKVQLKRRKGKNNSRTDHEDNGAMTGNETERDEGAKSQQSRKSRNKSRAQDTSGGRKSRPDNDETARSRAGHGKYPPHLYDENDVLDLWRQERNDYLKRKFKPTVHDHLYSQQWAKADSYLENQRRRQMRDSQGFYFPYKKYTLKDYKDIQKLNVQNPYADVVEPIIDRKERQRKRYEYGLQIERQLGDNPGTRQVPPREFQPQKPWHLSNAEPNDPETGAVKRERALEYAKTQVKYRPMNKSKKQGMEDPDSELRHQNQHRYSPNSRDEHNDSYNEHTHRTQQSYDDDD